MSRNAIAIGLALAVAACVPVGWVSDKLAVAGDTTPAPPTVTEEVWRTELPDEVTRVAAGGPGMFALQGDGVVAIDGATGEVRWRYRSADARAVSVVANPAAPTVLLVTSAEGVAEIVGLDAITGDELFVLPFRQPDYADPWLHIAMTNDAFVLMTDHQSVRAFGLDTGRELWVAPMPEQCSEIVAWFGNSQATRSGLVVPCAGFGQGGFAFLDTRLGEFTWSDVREGLIGDTLAEPHVSPDGLMVRVRFLDVGPGSGSITESAILDVETGASLRETDRFLGHLGFDRTFLHTGEINQSGIVRLENIQTGQVSTIDRPCPVADPLVVLSSGVLWMKFNRVIGEQVGDNPCQFVFTPIDGDPTRLSIDFEFANRPRVVVGSGTIMLTEGSTVIGLR